MYRYIGIMYFVDNENIGHAPCMPVFYRHKNK